MKPYKGLEPYQEQDQDNFYGREADKRILIDKILTHKLTFLFAASGVGKSSLLQAAVLPTLKQPTRKDRQSLNVVYFKDWVGNPLVTLPREMSTALKKQQLVTEDYEFVADLNLKAFFRLCTAFTSEPLIVILDQFEEFFNYQRFTPYFSPLINQLADAIHDREAATAFVISMREDFALELNAFKQRIPTFLIDNFYRLEKLTVENAKLAVVAPVEKLGFVYEEPFLNQLLEDLSLREQRERYGLEAVLDEVPRLVEPAHLQMICMQLWEIEQTNPAQCIRQSTYVAKGGAEGLLTAYFLNKITDLSAQEKKLASGAFNYLVNRHGTKMPRALPDLAKLLRVETPVLEFALDKLERGRILRRQMRYGTAQVAGVLWYELHHDIFSKPIYDWNEKYKNQQRLWRFYQTTIAVFMAGTVLFVGYDAWVNSSAYHLRLSVKSGLSDVVEVYQGQTGSWDLWNQQHYLYETAYERLDIEADKLFIEQPIIEIHQLNTEIIERLPLAERIAAYLANGDLEPALALAQCSLSEHDMQLAEKLILDLVSFRSTQTYRLLGNILIADGKPLLKEKIALAFEESKAPKQVVPFLITAIKDENDEVRQQARWSLNQLGDKSAVAPLIALLEDQDSGVRRQSVGSLGQLGDKSAVTPLIALLKDQDSDVRRQAAEVLGQLGDKSAVTPLIALLKDQYSSVRYQAAESLGQLGDKSAVMPLIALLEDQDSRVRGHAARSLGKLGDKSALVPLIASLKDQDSYVREQAAESLGQLGEKSAVVPLIALLGDQNSGVRYQAAKSLGQLGEKSAVVPLIALLKDQEYDVRQQAAQSLGQLGDKSAVEPLIVLLEEPNSWLRLQAAESLGQLGEKRAVASLISLLDDYEMGWRAAESLGGLENLENVIEESLIAWLKKQQTFFLFEQETKVIELLGKLYKKNKVKHFIALLDHQNHQIRRQIVVSLSKLGDKSAVAPLITLLKDPSNEVRKQAAESLVQLGEKSAVAPLITLLKEQDSDVHHQVVVSFFDFLEEQDIRQQAAYSIAQLGDKSAVAPLIALLKDQDSNVRWQTAKSLAQSGYKSVIAPLIALLKDQDSNVRQQAAYSLAQLGAKSAIKPLISFKKPTWSLQAIESLELLNNSETLSQKDDELLNNIEPVLSSWNDNFAKQITFIRSLRIINSTTENDNSTGKMITVELLGTRIDDAHVSFYYEDYPQDIDTAITRLSLFLNSNNIHLQIESIKTLGKIASHASIANQAKNTKDANTIITTLLPFLDSNNIHLQNETIKILEKIATHASTANQAKIRTILTNIASDKQELFGTRMKAIKSLGKLGTIAATESIIKIVNQFAQDEQRNSYLFAAYQALQDTKNPTALKFLQDALNQLTQQKQQWRKQRDSNGTTKLLAGEMGQNTTLFDETGEITTNTSLIQNAEQPIAINSLAINCPTSQITEHEKRWRYEHWEVELGYAIAQMYPETQGIDLLAHPLVKVREGAWFGIAKIGIPTVALIQKIYQRRQQSQHPHFRHAAFRAIDKSLITIEVYGEKADVIALKKWLPNIEDLAVKDRVQFTLWELAHRLE